LKINKVAIVSKFGSIKAEKAAKTIAVKLLVQKFQVYTISPVLVNRAKKVDSEIRKIVDKGYERAKKVLNEKIDDLHKLAKALLTYETLTGTEIEDLINKNAYPANKEDLKVEEEEQSSALGSMGLKPKIVH